MEENQRKIQQYNESKMSDTMSRVSIHTDQLQKLGEFQKDMVRF